MTNGYYLPRDQYRTFSVNLESEHVQELTRVDETRVMGINLDATAKLLVRSWIRNKHHSLSKEKGYPLSEEHSRSLKYSIGHLSKCVRLMNPGHVLVTLAGFDRYFIEQLPRAEPGRQFNNQFYHCSSERLIVHAITATLPEYISLADELSFSSNNFDSDNGEEAGEKWKLGGD